MGMTETVLVRMTPELRRRVGIERHRRGGLGVPETIRVVLDENLPPAPTKTDPDQIELLP